MNIIGVIRVIGVYGYILSFFMFAVGCCSVYFDHVDPIQKIMHYLVTKSFFTISFFCFISATFIHAITRKTVKSFYLREGMLSVFCIWLVTVLVCACPFTMSGFLDRYIDAVFETVSGLTTTGSTILHPKKYNEAGIEEMYTQALYSTRNIEYQFLGTVQRVIDSDGKILAEGVEATPQMLLLWRSLLHFFGGLGIIMFFVALLPALGQQGRMLFRYEFTGPSFSPLFPQIKDTVWTLVYIYIVLNILCIATLLLVKPDLPFIEAVHIAFATIATGGLSTKNASIAGYKSQALESAVMVFMFLGSVSFPIYYELFKGKVYKVFKPEFITFIISTIIFGLSISLCIWGDKKELLTGEAATILSFSDALHQGFFHTISSMSTTGFAICNFDNWPDFAQALVLLSMYFGGMSGSTAGGIKIIRIWILFLCVKQAMSTMFKPQEVKSTRIFGYEVEKEHMIGVLNFFLIFVLVSIIGVLLLILLGIDLETSLGLNACMINNTGLSFRMAGPTSSCAFLSPISKIICIAWMLLGRLELYVWLVLFMPSFWRKRG